ncbi:hypothetical protein [Anaerolentibacter hominis]|uniref:hypothetical protein n=1 Tax=Anaerolentibacter hominis TaxID=3079009 RepID=UPI0031B83D04
MDRKGFCKWIAAFATILCTFFNLHGYMFSTDIFNLLSSVLFLGAWLAYFITGYRYKRRMCVAAVYWGCTTGAVFVILIEATQGISMGILDWIGILLLAPMSGFYLIIRHDVILILLCLVTSFLLGAFALFQCWSRFGEKTGGGEIHGEGRDE